MPAPGTRPFGRLDGRRAFVSGGAQGIGAAIVRGFADAGAHVVIGDLDIETASSLAGQVGAIAARLGSKGGAVYSAAKGGVIAFTKSIARENARFGITANAIAPGPIRTPMLEAAVAQGGDKILRAMTDATLLRRLGEPEEVAAAVLFLASDQAAYITGETIGVSGGMGLGG